MTPSEIASKYIGQTEKPGNSGFTDSDFEMRMRAVGFETGQAWCSYFAELCFKEAYPERADELNKLFSAGAVATYHNFLKAGYKYSKTPKVDALVIWQKQVKGKPSWQGHAGIVSAVTDDKTFESVEGNTTPRGGREGYIVTPRNHQVVDNVQDGLEILGFIYIAE